LYKTGEPFGEWAKGKQTTFMINFHTKSLFNKKMYIFFL